MIERFWPRRKKLESELDAELRFHVARETEKNIRAGMGREEARRQALIAFGGVEQVKEECREGWAGRLVESLWRDTRFAVRNLLKNPGFALGAALTLALGIGANTAVFSAVYGVLFRPLPYEEGSRLVVLRQQAPLAAVTSLGFSEHEVRDYREQTQTLAGLVEYHRMSFVLLGGKEPEQVWTGVVSAEFFDRMGVKPLLGRTFLPGEDAHGAEPVLVLSHDYFLRSHGGRADLIGKPLRMNDRMHTVVGVLPPLPQYPERNDVYMPVSSCPFRSAESFRTNRTSRMMTVFGRLKPGISLEQAQADLNTIAGRLERQYPEAYPRQRGYGIRVESLEERLTADAKPRLLLLLGAAGLVLLIACANVANLTLAQLLRRERELAIRAALGASRGRLLVQLLTESTLLAMVGGALGLLVADAGMTGLVRFAARFTARAAEIRIDGSVLLFTLLVALGTGIVCGSMPLLASGRDLAAAIKEGAGHSTAGRGRRWLRSTLVISQVAVSFVLLVGAGLAMRSLYNLHRVDPGFNPERVLTLSINPNFSKYNDTQRFKALFTTLLEKLHAHPGVQSAAVAFKFPLNQSNAANRSLLIDGRAPVEGEPRPIADLRIASPRYFETLHIPVFDGRDFTDMDHESAPPVAIVNRSLARRFWPTGSPVGKRVSLNNGRTWLSIVGVIGDVRQYGLEREASDELYLPFAQNPAGTSLLVRTASDPMQMAREIRNLVYAMDSEQPVSNVQTLEKARDDALAPARLVATLLGLFAALTLIITVAGISAVMTLSVRQRTNEIGVRMALGASASRVVRMVVGQGMTLVWVGLGLGIAGALALSRIISTLLFGVGPADVATFLGVASIFAAVSALACALPAQRATAIDPLTALRRD